MMKNLKCLIVGDIHGRHEAIYTAYRKFLSEKYDRLIFLGDYADSYDRTNEDIFQCFKEIHSAKENHGERVILLIGNHDAQYLHHPDNHCSGRRNDIQPHLTYLMNEHKNKYQIAYQVGRYLFTHAGVQQRWRDQNAAGLGIIAHQAEVDDEDIMQLGSLLNHVEQSGRRWILYDVGMPRGGRDWGGPVWCDQSEIMKSPVIGLHQVVGHTPQKFMNKQTTFNGKSYNNTSVTFCDVLGTKEQFLTLEIPADEGTIF